MMADAALKLTTRDEDGRLVVFADGEIDVSTVAAFIHSLMKAADRESGFVVDLTNVRYMDSQGIRALRTAYQKAATTGGAMTIRGARGVAERVIRMVGLDRVIPMEQPAKIED